MTVFTIEQLRPIKDGMTISRDAKMGQETTVTFFSLGKDTSGLTPHRAPGNAIVFALEGKATIGYEGKDYTLSAGENFRFDKNGLHSVTAQGKFKMALLLVLE